MNFIANIPEISAVTKAKIKGSAGPSVGLGLEINSYTKAAIIIGMLMRNENSAARSRFVPVANAVLIVKPLRENPGTTAIPWASPVDNAEMYVISLSSGNKDLSLIKVVEKRTIAVIINVIGRMRAVNVLSIKSLNNKTNPTVTIVARINARLVLLNGCRTRCHIRLRNTISTASNVAI